MAERNPRRCSQNRDAEDVDTSVFDLSSSSGRVARRARNVACPASTSLGSSWNHVPTDGVAVDRRSVGSGSTSRTHRAELMEYERELNQREQVIKAKESAFNEFTLWQESIRQNEAQEQEPVASVNQGSTTPTVETYWNGLTPALRVIPGSTAGERFYPSSRDSTSRDEGGPRPVVRSMESPPRDGGGPAPTVASMASSSRDGSGVRPLPVPISMTPNRRTARVSPSAVSSSRDGGGSVRASMPSTPEGSVVGH